MNLKNVFTLRQEGRLELARDVMHGLLKLEPENAMYQYQMAWCFDNLGQEKAAVHHYVKAIQLGLPSADLKGAYLGLGSAYRALGEYVLSAETFQSALNDFPENNQFKVFYSMTLFNLNKHEEAMELLLNVLIETTSDKEILNYQKAILFYSNKLNVTWDE